MVAVTNTFVLDLYLYLIFQVNLGTLYHVKMVGAETEAERTQFYTQAHEYLEAGYQCDVAYGSIRLAHLYYKRGLYDRSMALLNKTLKPFYRRKAESVNVVDDVVFDGVHFGSFRKELWRPWLHGKYVYDVMFCWIPEPICPDEMTQSFRDWRNVRC